MSTISNSLDVHILLTKKHPRRYVEQCLESLHTAMDAADYPINVHLVPEVADHIGKGRAIGYSQGSAKWKTYVDTDDYVLPEAFTTLGKYLDTDHAAVAPQEYSEQNGQLHSFLTPRHHLILYKSDFIRDVGIADWRHYGDVFALKTAEAHPKGLLDLEDPLYVHRIYMDSTGRTLRRKYPEERLKLMEIFNEPIR